MPSWPVSLPRDAPGGQLTANWSRADRAGYGATRGNRGRYGPRYGGRADASRDGLGLEAASSAVHKLKDFEERVWKEKEEKEEEEEEEAEAEDKSVGKETDDCPRRS